MFAFEGKIIFKVRDTGIGISGTDLLHVFDEFRQVDGSTTRHQEGTGLGLAICQKLARLIGGEITAESNLSQGSNFILTLPEHCPDPSQALPAVQRTELEQPAPTLAKPTRALSRTILVVDDESEVCDLLRAHLIDGGY